MLKPESPQASFYGSYLYDRMVPADHLLKKISREGHWFLEILNADLRGR